MPKSAAQIKKEALSLPIERRAELAEELLASLSNPSPEELKNIWAEEAERRLKAYRSGKTKGIANEEAVAKIRARLKA
ncbi:MAG: addiction module protein [Planctomycetota bacterium]|nr:addiction module protein [Planctomycetota bacterium]